MFDVNDDNTFACFNRGEDSKVILGDTPSDAVYESKISDFAESQLRAEAMGIALTFIDEGEFSYEQLDALLVGFVVDDEDAEEFDDLTDEQVEQYEVLAETLVDAFTKLGAAKANAEAAVGGDDDAAQELGDFLADKMESNEKTDDEIVAKFAVEDGMIFEAKKRVVRGGKVKMIKKRIRKVRLSSAQRGALKKARRKAHTSAAKRTRKKSMRIRKSRGM